jgi:hypothetical protein
MTKILILGGYGYTGKLLARHLLARTDTEIIISGRDFGKATSFADELNNPRVTAKIADAANFVGLTQALQGVNLCLVAAPTTHHVETVTRACISAHADYLDIQFSSKKLKALYAAEKEIKQAGLCFITEAGYYPGLLAGMIRYAALKLDVIESAIIAGYLNLKDIPYSEAMDEIMEGFLDYHAKVYKNGQWTKSSSLASRSFNFGVDIGKRTCYPMFFEELSDIPKMLPALKETGFYISGSNWFINHIITPLILFGLKIAPERGLHPLGKLMWWGMGQAEQPYVYALKVEAKGHFEGKQAEVHARIAHANGYELTATSVVAHLLQYLDGTARKEGIFMMGHIVEPSRFINDIQKMGAQVIESLDLLSV